MFVRGWWLLRVCEGVVVVCLGGGGVVVVCL